MEYRLICNGRLLPGTDVSKALAALRELTGFSDEQIQAKLLSGKRGKLKSAPDEDKLEVLRKRFLEAGLDVVLEPSPAAPRQSAAPAAKRGRGARLGIAAAVVLLLCAGAAGYAWYWLTAPLPAQIHNAEAALADGHLIAIGHVDVGKLMTLQHYLLGELDPAALPVADAEKDLLDRLLDGPAQLRRNLQHGLFALHAGDTDVAAGPLWLLAGRFDRAAVLDALAQSYVVAPAPDGWSSLSERSMPDPMACPTDRQRQKPLYYLKLTPDWLVLSRDPEQGERVMMRLLASAAAAQDIKAWQRYRHGKLASVMVMSPAEAGQALGGLSGMMAAQAARQAEPVKAAAASLDVDLMSAGLHGNLRLVSDDPAWNSAITSGVRAGVAAMMADSGKVSPTLAGLLSQVRVSNGQGAVEVDVGLDASVMQQFSQVVQEGLGSAFGAGGSNDRKDGPHKDRIDPNPVDYAASASLASLPPLKLKSYETKPLFQRGPYGVNLEEIRCGDDGVFEMRVTGLVALPPVDGNGHSERRADLSMQVDAVTDGAGHDLLRDERCVKRGLVSNGVRNHEPATSGHVFQNRGQITKFLRLREGVAIEDVQRIHGHLGLSAPAQVRKFVPALRVGESVEHAGVRVYLSAIGDTSVSYQVSGEQHRLLEVRGLNKDGKVLRTGWRISSSGSGRVTQEFQGKVKGLEIFIAGRFVEHRQDFELSKLFAVRPKDSKPKPHTFAPVGIDPQAWSDYRTLHFDRLEVKQRDWYVEGKHSTPLGTASWPGVKMFLTHTPSSWGNAPHAHIYFPMLPELPGVLSAFSYRIEEPIAKDGAVDRYQRIGYPYRTSTGEWVVQQRLDDKPVALRSVVMKTGLADNAKLDRLKGVLIFRLPLATTSTVLPLKDLWQGAEVDGVKVTLSEVSRGTFPGYGLKIEGDLARLVNLHGLSADGQRVLAEPVNYQDAGYWTMTLPFGKGIEQVELVLATRQEVHELPFDIKAVYR
jgi:hypothetical protein